VLGLCLSCGGTPDGSITLVTGPQTDTFSRAPAPTMLVVDRIGQNGSKSEISRTRLPAETIDLGKLAETDVGAIAVSAIDDSGKVLVHGESLLVQWGALADTSLDVFVQRTGELATMPAGPVDIGATTTALVDGRYLFAAGGTGGTTATLYDLLTLTTLPSTPALPRAAKSLVAVSSAVLAIDDTGGTTVDLETGETTDLPAPTGGNYGEIVGGTTVGASDGSQYLVGATRPSGAPTPRVLFFDASGNGSFTALATPRLGACATWVGGRGLVIVGGAATGAGAELLASGTAAAASLPFPADPVRGCAAAALDGSHVLVAGGTDPSGATRPARVLDLGCTTSCAPTLWTGVVPLVRTEAATLAADAALLLGDDAGGASHAYRITAAGLAEVSLKTPRRGAHLVPTPTDAFAVIGGGPGVEQYLE
jgi:hypothetical protein